MSGASDDAEVGSFGEEAGKLFEALSGWAREHSDDAGDALSGLAAQAAASVGDLNDHIATGSDECTVCPICRGVHVVRQLSPEVKSHLVSAAASLAKAAATLMATQVPQDESPASDVEGSGLDDHRPEDV